MLILRNALTADRVVKIYKNRYYNLTLWLNNIVVNKRQNNALQLSFMNETILR